MTNLHEWTQGVCGDGAAILCDGEMITIERVVDTLNAAECLMVENIQLRAACGYPIKAIYDHLVHPVNPFKCGICDARKDGP